MEDIHMIILVYYSDEVEAVSLPWSSVGNSLLYRFDGSFPKEG